MTDALVSTQPRSDAELITSARAGDDRAFGELFQRHEQAARAAARSLARSRSDVDDLVAEAFTRVLQAIRAGRGPEIAFRPYLLTCVRNAFYDRTRKDKRLEFTDEPDDTPNLALIDLDASGEDRALIVQAYASLPERWQLALWHTEVEGRSATEVSTLLGIAPNAVAALTYRAREGLRQAYLQAHLQQQTPEECRVCRPNLGAYVRDGLASRDRRKVDAHLEGCDDCRALVAELSETNRHLRAILIPLILGVPAAKYLGALGGGKGLIGLFRRAPRSTQAVAGGAAAAGVVGMAVIAAAAVGGGEPVAAPTTTVAAVISEAPAPSAVVVPVTDSPTPATIVVPTDPTEPITVVIPTVPPTPPTAPPTGPAAPIVPPVPAAGPTTTQPRPTVTTAATTTTTAVASTNPPTTTSTTTTTTSTTTSTTTTTLPPTTIPPTTVPPTTVPPQPEPNLVLAAGPGGPFIAGEFGYVSITVRNLPDAGAAAGANPLVAQLAPIGIAEKPVVRLDLPRGVEYVSTTDWECSGGGSRASCLLPDLQPGDQTGAVIEIRLPSDSPPTITIPISVSSIGNSRTVTTSPVFSVTAAGAMGFARVMPGGIAVVGNTVMTCIDDVECAEARAGAAGGTRNGRHAHAMGFVDADGIQGTFNSSTAQVTLSATATVEYALLSWDGDTASGGSGGAPAPDTDARGAVRFGTPAGWVDLTADRVREPGGGSTAYHATADVTALIAGAGTYGVANVQTGTGSGVSGGRGRFGGWTLTIAYRDPTEPRSLVAVIDQFSSLNAVEFRAEMPIGFAPVARPRPAIITLASTEGDLGQANESATVNGIALVAADNPSNDVFNSTAVGPRTPADRNTFGIDADAFAVALATDASSVNLALRSPNDLIRLGAIGIVVEE